VDTANQRKHYHEAGVGEALRKALAAGTLRRDELFLQTKYTYVQGQDHRLPYDPAAPVAEQVRQSFASSLEHLHVDYVDAYVLHGPSTGEGLAPADFEAWAAMEQLHAAGATRLLGVSNVSCEQLRELWERATVRPSLVQNRCFARTGWDRDVRAFCRERGLLYEGFSLLTANRKELAQPEFLALVARLGATPAQVVFRFARAVGMVPLTGTTDPEHMRQDLASGSLLLDAEDVQLIERVADLG
jgi:diketogulonate reductase-like aldo/keto reductase